MIFFIILFIFYGKNIIRLEFIKNKCRKLLRGYGEYRNIGTYKQEIKYIWYDKLIKVLLKIKTLIVSNIFTKF